MGHGKLNCCSPLPLPAKQLSKLFQSMKIHFQLSLKAWMTTMLAAVFCHLAGAQTGQVTLSFANSVMLSPTEVQFDVMMSNTGPSNLQLNGANIHAIINQNESDALMSPVYELVEVGPHFAGMKSSPVLAWSQVNEVNLRGTQMPHGEVESAPTIPKDPTMFFRAKLSVSAPVGNLELLFHEAKLPSISLSVFMNGEPTPRTINVAGTQYGNVVLGGAASFGLSPVEPTGAGGFGVLSVFPTPTDGKVTMQVNLPQFANLTVSVTDANGRLLQVSDMELGQGLNEVQVDLTRFAAGTYFVKLDNGKAQLTERIVKQ